MVHPNGSDLEILVADDEDYCLVIRKALEANHFAGGVRFVHSGFHVQQYLHHGGDYTGSKIPDLIIFDIDVAGQDAYATLRDIRSDPSLAFIPVIVFIKPTTPEEEIDLCHDFGVSSYLSKPDSFQGWVNLMGSILGSYSPRSSSNADALIPSSDSGVSLRSQDESSGGD